jgi:nucleoside-diphosphate-sugar epimerase
MRIILTGSNGYVGSVLGPLLTRRGHSVVGLDAGLFSDCTFLSGEAGIPTLWKDIRDIERADVAGADAIVHLAALSNDPLGSLRREWTRAINVEATLRIAEIATLEGIQRFIFSSSCIVYGAADGPVNEDAEVNPQTDYARSKVEAEIGLRDVLGRDCHVVILRNGTIYGASPRMRFDTVLNDFAAAGVSERVVVVTGDGTPWRPVVHVNDVCAAFVRVLEAPRHCIEREIFNVGASHLNARVIDLADAVAQAAGDVEVRVTRETHDDRSYIADFARFRSTFPAARFATPPEGAAGLVALLSRLPRQSRWRADMRFTRLEWLRHLIQTQRLDRDLRWT